MNMYYKFNLIMLKPNNHKQNNKYLLIKIRENSLPLIHIWSLTENYSSSVYHSSGFLFVICLLTSF